MCEETEPDLLPDDGDYKYDNWKDEHRGHDDPDIYESMQRFKDAIHT